MASSQKVHVILTKYFMDLNQGHHMIYLQNIKFVGLILWSGWAYTDDAYTTTAAITIPYYDSFHESRLYRLIMAMPNEPKTSYLWLWQNHKHVLTPIEQHCKKFNIGVLQTQMNSLIQVPEVVPSFNLSQLMVGVVVKGGEKIKEMWESDTAHRPTQHTDKTEVLT